MVEPRHDPSSCPLCNGRDLECHGFEGTAVLQAAERGAVEKFRFATCSNCSFAWNLDYKNPDFDACEYDNSSDDHKASIHDQALANEIEHLIQSAPCFAGRKPRIVEIGCGRRYGLLARLGENPDFEIIGIDPIYQSYQPESPTAIRFADSLEGVRDTITEDARPTVLIARNSLEYFMPDQLRSLFRSLFPVGGGFLLELTELRRETHGSIFHYTECSSFYRPSCLQRLLEAESLTVELKRTTHIHGDCRTEVMGSVTRHEPHATTESPILMFSDVNDLSQHLNEDRGTGRVVMWGAGGRNLMFSFNEGHESIDLLVDHNASKHGALPGGTEVTGPDSIRTGDRVVVLNSRWLSDVRAYLEERDLACPIVVLNDRGASCD
jgi:hypothetical protein